MIAGARQSVPSPIQPAIPLEPPPPPAPLTAVQRLEQLIAEHPTGPHFFIKIIIGRDMAEAMMARNYNNRKMKIRTYRRYARSMKERRWLPSPYPIVFDTAGVLRDGQHRLQAIIESGVEIEMTVVFGSDPSEAEAFDMGSVRSAADIAGQAGTPAQKMSAALARTLLIIEYQDDETADDRIEVTRLCQRLQAEEPAFGAAVKAAQHNWRLSSPTSLSLAYWFIATESSHSERLAEFWQKLTTGADLPARSPILRLRDYLLGPGRQQVGAAGNIRKAAAMILAWNAWIERKTPRNFAWDFGLQLPEVR